MREIILIILLGFISEVLPAQESFSYINYTVENGLPSNETYSVFEDKKGYIWVATDRGVARFDGYEFEIFTTQDGLPDNTIFRFYEDYKGRIWLFSFNGKVGYYFRNTFFTVPLDLDVNQFYITYVGVSPDELLTIRFHGSQGSSIVNYDLGRQILLDSNYYEGVNYMLNTTKAKIKEERKEFYEILFKRGLAYPEMKINDSTLFIYSTSFYVPENKKCFILADKEIEVKKVITLDDFGKTISGINKDNEFWYLTSYGKRIYQFSLEKPDSLIQSILFTSHIPSGVLTDRFGGMWISSLNKGVLYIPNRNIISHTFSDEIRKGGLYRYIKANNVEFISNQNNELFQRKSSKKKMVKIVDLPDREQTFRFEDSTFYISCRQEAYLYDGNGEIKKKLKKNNEHTGYTDILKNSKKDIHIYCDATSMLFDSTFITIKGSKRLVSIQQIGDTLWTGGMNGLFAVSLKNKKQISFDKSNLLQTRITDLESIGNILFIATRGEGILLKNGIQVFKIDEKDGLADNIISKIITDGKNTIWVSSNSGVSKIHFRSFNPLSYKLINLGRDDGILSREINDIQLQGDSLYVLTSDRVLQLHKDYQYNTTIPLIYLDKLKINDSTVNIPSDSVELKYNENNIELTYQGIYYPNANALKYEYSIDGGVHWQYTQNRSISLLSLPYGSYHLMIKVVTPRRIESEIKNLYIYITPPFWFTWWFYILEALVVLFIIYGIVKYYLFQDRLKHKAVEMELKSLRAQMNPHFTFNTMNSIQHFILKNKKEDALNFVRKFSKLIRMILENTMYDQIPIQQEIDALRYYLEIEQTRLEHKFSYVINIDKRIDSDYEEIPSMILQPYVENAIWHGIMSKEGSGEIKVEILKENNGYSCIVEDNGIGREAAQKTESEFKTKKKSFGMKITEDRLKLFNQEKNGRVTARVIDLKSTAGKALGTRIEIKIEE